MYFQISRSAVPGSGDDQTLFASEESTFCSVLSYNISVANLLATNV